MKIVIDKNNLLTIENPSITQTKEYCNNVGWYNFCDFDKWMIVYHKINLVLESAENAMKLFKGFSEDTWEKYYFLHKLKENKLEELNIKLNKLWSQLIINKTEKGFCIENKDEELIYNPISFLFWLWLVYGDFNVKNNDLKSIKIQIQLFWIHKENVDIIDEAIGTLADNGIFLKKNIQETKDGIVYQITSSDYELLQIFAKLYEPIEKWLEINKYTDVLKIKEKLVEFLKTNKEIPNEWKKETIEEIENWMIKVLAK